MPPAILQSSDQRPVATVADLAVKRSLHQTPNRKFVLYYGAIEIYARLDEAGNSADLILGKLLIGS